MILSRLLVWKNISSIRTQNSVHIHAALLSQCEAPAGVCLRREATRTDRVAAPATRGGMRSIGHV